MADRAGPEDARKIQDFQEFDVGDRLRIVGHAGYEGGEPFVGTVERVQRERSGPDSDHLDLRTRYVLKLDPREVAPTQVQINALKFDILHDFLVHEGFMGKHQQEIHLASVASSAYTQRAICDGGASTTLVGGGHVAAQTRHDQEA